MTFKQAICSEFMRGGSNAYVVILSKDSRPISGLVTSEWNECVLIIFGKKLRSYY
jgi:hypothetical protein